MGDSKNITATEGRLKSNFSSAVNTLVNLDGIQRSITKVQDKTSLRTGTVTKYYPYLDKAEVKLDSTKKTVLCKILHKYGGELLDLYTPVADRKEFCDKLKEPCYIPRAKLHCVVVNLHDADSDEHLLLGYYQNEEFIGLNPAKPGNIKLCTREATNQYWIKFGFDGLDLRVNSTPTVKVGERDENMDTVDYASSEETYTKSEVDKLLSAYEERIARLEELLEVNNDGGS